MILYCDTSAVVKLYLKETASDIVVDAANRADAVAIARIGWTEFHAATSRREREVPADADAMERARQALRDDWPHFVKIDATQPLVEQAGALAEGFALRGYDGVHLAAARQLTVDGGEDVLFACFDRQLNRAAGLLGMSLLAS